MKTDRQIKQENQKNKKDKNTDVKEKNTFESKFSKGIFRASYFNPKLRSEFDIASEIIRYISKDMYICTFRVHAHKKQKKLESYIFAFKLHSRVTFLFYTLFDQTHQTYMSTFKIGMRRIHFLLFS